MKEAAFKATFGENWRNKVIIKGREIKRKKDNNNNQYHTNPAQWWDEECKQVLDMKKKKFKKWKSQKNM